MLRPAPRRGLVCVLGCGRPSPRFSSVGLNRAAVSLCLFCWGAVWSSFSRFSRFGKRSLFLRTRFFCPSATFVPALVSQRFSSEHGPRTAWRPRLQTHRPPPRPAPPPPAAAWLSLSLMPLSSGAAVLRSGRKRPFGSSGLVPPVPNLLTRGGSPWVPATRPVPLAGSCFSCWGRVSLGRWPVGAGQHVRSLLCGPISGPRSPSPGFLLCCRSTLEHSAGLSYPQRVPLGSRPMLLPRDAEGPAPGGPHHHPSLGQLHAA